jgi:hypothetical protein
MKLIASITLGQIWSKLYKCLLGYCVVFTCLSWVSISYPKQVGTLVDYVNDLETDKHDPIQVIEPTKSEARIIYI